MEPRSPTRTWRVLALRQEIDEPDAVLRDRAAERAGIDPQTIRGLRIAHRALDARRTRGNSRHGGPAERVLRFVVHVDLQLDSDFERTAPAAWHRARKAGHVLDPGPPGSFELDTAVDAATLGRAVVVGAGPAGLFAALTLARNGVAVELLDRGPRIDLRSRKLARFLRTRELDPEANLLFGEGGAGTYSDGKIYTRVDDPLELPILEELVTCGAPEAIAYDARAHIGTDKLHRILPRLRERMETAGVTFRWDTRVDGIVTDDASPRRVRAVQTSDGEIACDALFLALGHSARDTFRALEGQGLRIVAKPFQFGVRIEHPQELIDRGRYGNHPAAKQLGPSYYGLVSKAGAGAASAHTFCMCPGGKIVASVNTAGFLCTNGMSNSRHSSPFANAALVTTLGPRELGDDAWAGVRFQEDIERRAFDAGGGDYTAPAQRAADFLSGRASDGDLGRCSYGFGIRSERIDELLPDVVRDALRRALGHFERQIPGYAGEHALMVGIESRSSSPQRLPRNRDSRIADGFANLYPIGEGAGYAGGIMSAAIDGAKSAQVALARPASHS